MNRPRRLAGPTLSRRRLLGIGAAVAASVSPLTRATVAGATSGGSPRSPLLAAQAAEALRPAIRPRADWAGGEQPVKGALVPEDDVRFLLVHHTASTNAYDADGVVGQIRGFYDFHTGPEKGWPDVAYNFFIDRFGTIWEGREGSVAGPVRGDATGGSQGFALLCSLIGNYAEEPVTAEQQASLSQLLAWLGATYAVDTTPGAMTSFVSRGSNKWPAGTEVSARTISGHRDMSTTSCPGDFAYDLLADDIPLRVSALREAAGAEPATSTTETPGTTADDGGPTSSATGDPAVSAADAAPATSESTVTPGDGADAATAATVDGVGPTDGGDDGLSTGLVVLGAVLGAFAAIGGVISRVWTGPDE
ncbi:MAG: peptidoglycan recognition family protein [Actinomycetota bacterium]